MITEAIIIIILSVPLLLIRIGEGIRSILAIILGLIIITYSFIRDAFILIGNIIISAVKFLIVKISLNKYKSALKSLISRLQHHFLITYKRKEIRDKEDIIGQSGKILTEDDDKFIPLQKTKSVKKPRLHLSELVKFYFSCFTNAVKYFFPKKFLSLPLTNNIHVLFSLLSKKITSSGLFFSGVFKKDLSKQKIIYSFKPKITFSFLSFITGIALSTIFIFIPLTTYLWLLNLPNPQLLTQGNVQVSTKIYDRNNILLYEIFADQNRTPVKLSEMPQHVIDATIAIEDKDFYDHQGFSPKAMIRAFYETFFQNHLQGGSTISQQLIKSSLLTPEVTIERKIKELILSFWAEQIYSKEQILEMYLNQVPYGGTAWGIESASQTYFGKKTADLTISEAALLAGLPQAPSTYSPFGNTPYKALERQREVLEHMTETKKITLKEFEKALNQELIFTNPQTSIRSPHFVMYVKNILEKMYGTRVVERGGLRVKTSLDIDVQEQAETIVKNQIDSLVNLKVGNGALLITNPKTGEILAMVGSRDYFDQEKDGNVNVTTSLRQPGSSIKVVNYAAALENGFSAASIINDSPVTYKIPGSVDYTPVNYDGQHHGPTPLRYALANSYNIPAVKVLAKIGVATMLDKGKMMGIDSWTDRSRYGLSLTLGGGDVTMLDMAEVFGTLANKGKHVPLKPIIEVSDYAGNMKKISLPDKTTQAVSEETAWIISNILSDNNARTSAFGSNSSLLIPGKTVSVKTGTSNDKRDNWTIGFTPSYVVTVWVGNNDNSPMDPVLTSGVTGASPIWHDTMNFLISDKPDEPLPRPSGIISIPCYHGKNEYFIKGTEPAGGRCAPLPTPTPTPESV